MATVRDTLVPRPGREFKCVGNCDDPKRCMILDACVQTPVETCNCSTVGGCCDVCKPLLGPADALVVLPTSPAERKNIPMVRGLLDYFPAALAAVAELSQGASTQHKHTEMHWERGKSSDHADCIVRHVVDRGTVDIDGKRHSTKVAWRALALLQEELEAAGAPRSRASR